MGGWTDRRAGGWAGGRTDGQAGGGMDKRGRIERRADGQRGGGWMGGLAGGRAGTNPRDEFPGRIPGTNSPGGEFPGRIPAVSFRFCLFGTYDKMKISFSDSKTTAPSGWLRDAGERLSDRGNGYFYGWKCEVA